MSFNDLPPLEGTSECEGNEDEYSDSSASINVENHLSNDEAFLGFKHSQSFIEENLPSGRNILNFSQAFHTLTVPDAATSTPVGSPKESKVGALVEKFEPRK